jgi:ATP-dependent helicase/nuclease subunit A
MASGIWRRALESERRLVEVPFQVLQEQAGALPTILRGVIDLAFREDGGWVLVDFKTDRVEGTGLREAVRRYSPQVRLYSEAWGRGSGERIKEAFLSFTSTDTSVRIETGGDV